MKPLHVWLSNFLTLKEGIHNQRTMTTCDKAKLEDNSKKRFKTYLKCNAAYLWLTCKHYIGSHRLKSPAILTSILSALMIQLKDRDKTIGYLFLVIILQSNIQIKVYLIKLNQYTIHSNKNNVVKTYTIFDASNSKPLSFEYRCKAIQTSKFHLSVWENALCISWFHKQFVFFYNERVLRINEIMFFVIPFA